MNLDTSRKRKRRIRLPLRRLRFRLVEGTCHMAAVGYRLQEPVSHPSRANGAIDGVLAKLRRAYRDAEPSELPWTTLTY